MAIRSESAVFIQLSMAQMSTALQTFALYGPDRDTIEQSGRRNKNLLRNSFIWEMKRILLDNDKLNLASPWHSNVILT